MTNKTNAQETIPMPRHAQIIVALDVPSAREVAPLLRTLPTELSWFKVGLELFCADGPAALAPLRKADKHIFLDLKLHDIPRTVARSIRSAVAHGVGMLTVHAAGGRDMLKAAAEAARESNSPAKLVAVTTLTSLNQDDLRDLGVTRALTDHTIALGEMAVACGIDGLVCSPLEAQAFRTRLGASPILVTPGIRPAGAGLGDQKRVADPASAVQAGADFLVVGRPILEAADPADAARALLREVRAASV
jgi:orotidine-5'-phosphate decarboxylase